MLILGCVTYIPRFSVCQITFYQFLKMRFASRRSVVTPRSGQSKIRGLHMQSIYFTLEKNKPFREYLLHFQFFVVHPTVRITDGTFFPPTKGK